jgi:uncharacterized membrane protein YgcG
LNARKSLERNTTAINNRRKQRRWLHDYRPWRTKGPILHNFSSVGFVILFGILPCTFVILFANYLWIRHWLMDRSPDEWFLIVNFHRLLKGVTILQTIK